MSRLRTCPDHVNQLDEWEDDEVHCPCGGDLLLEHDKARDEHRIRCDSCHADLTAHLQETMGAKAAVRFASEHHTKLDRLARLWAKRGEDRAMVRVLVELAVLTAPLLVLETDYDSQFTPRLLRHIRAVLDEWRAATGVAIRPRRLV